MCTGLGGPLPAFTRVTAGLWPRDGGLSRSMQEKNHLGFEPVLGAELFCLMTGCHVSPQTLPCLCYVSRTCRSDENFHPGSKKGQRSGEASCDRASGSLRCPPRNAWHGRPSDGGWLSPWSSCSSQGPLCRLLSAPGPLRPWAPVGLRPPGCSEGTGCHFRRSQDSVKP